MAQIPAIGYRTPAQLLAGLAAGTVVSLGQDRVRNLLQLLDIVQFKELQHHIYDLAGFHIIAHSHVAGAAGHHDGFVEQACCFGSL